MSESFQSVFMAPRMVVQKEGIQEIHVKRQGMKKLLEDMEIRKAMHPIEVSRWILKEHRPNGRIHIGYNEHLAERMKGTQGMEEGKYSAKIQR